MHFRLEFIFFACILALAGCTAPAPTPRPLEGEASISGDSASQADRSPAESLARAADTATATHAKTETRPTLASALGVAASKPPAAGPTLAAGAQAQPAPQPLVIDSARAGKSSGSAEPATASSSMSRPDSASNAASPPARTPEVPMPLLSSRSKKDSMAYRQAVLAGMRNDAWPVAGPQPLPGSIFPNTRIVAFYGNPLSRRMGILGELDPQPMLAKLDTVVESWRKADPATPVRPALHLVAMVAQGSPGRDGKWRAKMADTLIERVIQWAETRNALVFLDLQVGTSTIQAELPRFMKFLELPNVHLGMDPEFSMKGGQKPGTRIGTYDAADVNWAVQQLAQLVRDKGIPPKVLIVHRFTRPMLTNAEKIELDPHVQIVIDMDGWGAPWLKFDSYQAYVQGEPVQFTGFKLFYKNDTRGGRQLLTPRELLGLVPAPLYIQYQ